MKLARLTLASSAALAALFCAAAASATTTTIALPDLLPRDADRTIAVRNTGQTFTGNGFVGMRPSNEFLHAFAIEHTSSYDSKALLQADMRAFAGATINSATLSFVFVDTIGSYDMIATGFVGTGSLGYQFTAPPTTLGSATGAVAQGANTFDVTDIVASAVASDADWLNLLLQGSGCCLVTLTQGLTGGPDRPADAALLRLTVDYTAAGPITGGVPEPATWAMLLTGFTAVGATMRAGRRRMRAA